MLPSHPCQRICTCIKRCSCIVCFLIGIIPQIIAQPANDRCEKAIDLTLATFDSLFTCIDGTFQDATPDSLTREGCELSLFRTVWYKFDLYYEELVNIHVQSEQLETPIIRLFQGINGTCLNLEPVPLEDYFFQQTSYCITGVDGKAEVIALHLYPTTYYIAITAIDMEADSFALCVNGLMDITPCISMSPINVTDRSFGGPLSGPFLRGEIISFQAEVMEQSYLSEGCDYFQGLVPVLGTSWDSQFADRFTPPLYAQLNDHQIDGSSNALYSGSWDWYGWDINYHLVNENIKLDYFDDALTFPALKNALYEPNIPSFNSSLYPGCCSPCWMDGGSILPPGWFCHGNGGNCILEGKIRYRFGDGSQCGQRKGPWLFTFSLPVSENIPECETDGDLELYISLFPFGDGAIGSWTPNYKCVNDPYAFKRLPVVCNDVVMDTIPCEFDGMLACPGDTITIDLDSLLPPQFGVAYWTYEFDQPTSQVPASGYSLPGHKLVLTEISGGGPGQYISGWLQAFRSGRELIGRFPIRIQYLTLPVASFEWQIIGQKVKFKLPPVYQPHYHWDFGDGDTSVLRTPEHIYKKEGKYNVQLIVSSDCGADTTEQEIYLIWQLPDARFEIPDRIICENDSITFSHSFDGIIDSLVWHFAGGIPAESHDSVVTVTYPSAGLYNVGLEMYNALGSDLQTHEQAVLVQEKVDLTYTVWVRDSLIDLIYLGEDGTHVEWQIGDSLHFEGDSLQYIFLIPGLYPVTLYAENECGKDSLHFGIEIILTSSVELSNENDFLVYPNPARDVLYVFPSRDLHPAQLKLQDVNGIVRYEANLVKGDSFPLRIDLRSLGLSPGIYVCIFNDNSDVIKKVVIY